MDIDVAMQLMALVADCGGPMLPRTRLLAGGRVALASASTEAIVKASRLDAYAQATSDALLVCGVRLVQEGSPSYDLAAAEICVDGAIRPLEVCMQPERLLHLL